VPGTWCLVDYFRPLEAILAEVAPHLPDAAWRKKARQLAVTSKADKVNVSSGVTAPTRRSTRTRLATKTAEIKHEEQGNTRDSNCGEAQGDAISQARNGVKIEDDALQVQKPEYPPFVRFLSHFHGDHYSGLSDQWDGGVVHCTKITADLLTQVMGVAPHLVKSYPFNEEIEFQGFSITFLDANHAPGSALLLVRRHEDNSLFLHCGDMRYAPRMEEYESLQKVRGKLDTVFLDTTYANPKHVFPTQEESIKKAAMEAKEFVEADPNAKTLVMISAYTIGKERIVFGVAEAIGSQAIYASERKRKVMQCLQLPPERAAMLSADLGSQVHMCRMGAAGDVWPYFQPNFVNIQKYLDNIREQTNVRFDRVIAFLPTGWAESSNWNKLNRSRINDEGNMMVNLIPYSEHSNFPELEAFVRFLKPGKIYPTVFSNPHEQRKIVHRFRHYIDQGKAKRKFLAAFTKAPSSSSMNDDLSDGHDKSVENTSDTPSLASCKVPETKSASLQKLGEDYPNEEQKLCENNSGVYCADCDHVIEILDDEDEVLEDNVTNNNLELQSRMGTLSAVNSNSWSCTACTYLNVNPNGLVCIICETPRPSPKQVVSKPLPKVSAPPVKKRKAGNIPTLFKFNFGSSASNSSNRNAPKATGTTNPQSVSSPQSLVEQVRPAAPQADNIPVKSSIHSQNNKSVSIEDKEDLFTQYEGKQISAMSHAISKEGKKPQGSSGSFLNTLAQPTEVIIPDLATEIPVFTPPSQSNLKDVPFAVLIEALKLTSGTTKRLKKHNVLVNAFRCGLAITQEPDMLVKMLSLSMGRIANEYEGVELSVGGSIVSEAIRSATGTTAAEMRKLYKDTGDLGDVAYQCKMSQRTLFGVQKQPLTVSFVFDTLRQISDEKGTGSKKRRTDLVLKLLRRCVGEETRYLVRMLIRNLRIGASEASILDSFAEAALWHSRAPNPPTSDTIADVVSRARAAFNCVPNMGRFVMGLIEGNGIEGLEAACTMTPGIPVRPMLANVCHGVEEFMDAFDGRGAFTCEYKYDGQRIQIHYTPEQKFCIYSRHCRDSTNGFPEVTGIMRDAQKFQNKPFILDAEVVAVDRSTDEIKILPFQTLSTRARKNDEAVIIDAKVTLCVFAFDLISFDGESLMDLPLRQRRARLTDAFELLPGRFALVQSQDFEPVDAENRAQEIEAMMKVMQDALHNSCEGLMAKLLDHESATYQPNYRSSVWLKLKQDYITDQDVGEQLVGGGLGDTLDLVPIGGWHGQGRKAKWWSPFLLACWDPDQEVYRAVCKCMSGFTDAFYESQNEFYNGNEIDQDGDSNDPDDADDEVMGSPRMLTHKPLDYDAEHQPRAWFRASQVWEIRGAELTLSENATAARGLVPDGQGGFSERGLSVRFPRFIRVRTDKRPEDATTPAQLVEMYLKQTRR